MPAYIDLLKSLYNIFLMKVQTEELYVNNAPEGSLTKTIAQAKMDAYQDCTNQIFALIQQQVPNFG